MVRATKRRCFSRYEWFIPKIMLMFPSIKGVDWNTKLAVIVVNLRIQCCKFFTKHKFSPWRYSYYIVRNYYALVVLKYHIYLVICSYNLSLNIELQFLSCLSTAILAIWWCVSFYVVSVTAWDTQTLPCQSCLNFHVFH